MTSIVSEWYAQKFFVCADESFLFLCLLKNFVLSFRVKNTDCFMDVQWKYTMKIYVVSLLWIPEIWQLPGSHAKSSSRYRAWRSQRLVNWILVCLTRLPHQSTGWIRMIQFGVSVFLLVVVCHKLSFIALCLHLKNTSFWIASPMTRICSTAVLLRRNVDVFISIVKISRYINTIYYTDIYV